MLPATRPRLSVDTPGTWPAVVRPGPTMRAVVIRGFGPPDVLRVETVPTPEPAPGEVLVQVAAVSVGRFLDVTARAGRHPYPGYTFPHVFGAEHAGVVAEVGPGVDGALVGRRVAVFPNVTDGTCTLCRRGYDELCPALELIGMHRPGAYAHYVAVPVANLHEVSDDLTPEQATNLALAGPLVLNQLRRAHFESGQWVLVQGAAGALGSLTVSLLRHLGGHVIATSRSAAKRRKLLDLGAEAVLDPATDVVEQVHDLTDGRGADIVIDSLGEPAVWATSMASVTTGGFVVTSGAFLGPQVTVDLSRLYLRGQHIVGVRTGNAAGVAALWAEVAKGFRPVVGTTFPLEDAARAHRLLEDDAALGRIALLVEQCTPASTEDRS